MGRTGTELAERPVAARTIEVIPDPVVVPQVRQMVRDDLRHGRLPESLVDNTLVVLTELLSNSIMHARPVRRDDVVVGIIVRWEASEANVRVEVTDGGGPSLPRQHAHSLTDDAGRGLTIVDELTRGWTVIRRPGTTTVHAELSS